MSIPVKIGRGFFLQKAGSSCLYPKINPQEDPFRILIARDIFVSKCSDSSVFDDTVTGNSVK